MPISKKQSQNTLGVSFWEKHVRSYRASQLSQGEYCRRNSLKLSAFGYWYRKLNYHISGKALKGKSTTCSKSDFIEISNLANNRVQSSKPTHMYLEMEFGNGWKIKIPAGWEAESLKLLLTLIKEEVCL